MNRKTKENPIGRQAWPAGAWRCVHVALALALASGLVGCQGEQSDGSLATPPAVTDRVDYLLLQVMPTAVAWSGRAVPDGLQLSAMLLRSEEKIPVLGDGTMEFAIYEGILTRGQIAQTKPFYQWRFTTAELSQARRRTQVGWGYAFRLGWGDRVPRSGSVTLTGQFVPKDGLPVYSNPWVISMAPR